MTLTLNHNGFDDRDTVFMSLALVQGRRALPPCLILRKAGIEVSVGLLQHEAERDLHQYLVNNN